MAPLDPNFGHAKQRLIETSVDVHNAYHRMVQNIASASSKLMRAETVEQLQEAVEEIQSVLKSAPFNAPTDRFVKYLVMAAQAEEKEKAR